MKKNQIVCAVLIIASLLGCGCSSVKVEPAATASERQQIEANCFSLLHQLLDQEKDVSKVLIVKRESTEVNQLVKKIAAAASVAAKRVEELARQEPPLPLKHYQLPAGEAATREAIENTRRKELLNASGDDFEFSLLLTQVEALSYAQHLAKVAAANATQPDRARYLASLSEEMKNLQTEVVALLRSRMAPSQLATTQPDNTARNIRERGDQTLTPLDQGNSQTDRAVTAQIRKEIIATKNMSVNGQNVKIITKQGKVTLRGPVNTAEEKRLIGDIATRIAQAGNVDNQLEVK